MPVIELSNVIYFFTFWLYINELQLCILYNDQNIEDLCTAPKLMPFTKIQFTCRKCKSISEIQKKPRDNVSRRILYERVDKGNDPK